MRGTVIFWIAWLSVFASIPSIHAQLVVRPSDITIESATGPVPDAYSLLPSPGGSVNPPSSTSYTENRLRAFEVDNAALRRRNELSRQTIHTLAESLAVANAEREVFKREYGELKLRMEALGLASVGDDKQALEQRLLESVNDLRLLRVTKEKTVERMVALSETVLLYLKTSTGGDPQTRLEIEAQLRSANEVVAGAGPPENPGDPSDLSHGKVISVNEGISLVVVNLGLQHGVKLGMPFQIIRDNHSVGHARVVDVRDRISGAVVEDYGSNTEKVKIGDAMRVDVQS